MPQVCCAGGAAQATLNAGPPKCQWQCTKCYPRPRPHALPLLTSGAPTCVMYKIRIQMSWTSVCAQRSLSLREPHIPGGPGSAVQMDPQLARPQGGGVLGARASTALRCHEITQVALRDVATRPRKPGPAAGAAAETPPARALHCQTICLQDPCPQWVRMSQLATHSTADAPGTVEEDACGEWREWSQEALTAHHAALEAAIQTGCRWLMRGLPQHEATWMPEGTPPTVVLPISSYMVVPLALNSGGHRAEALAVLEFIDEKFMDGAATGDMPCVNPACLSNGQMIAYMPAWTAHCAAEMGRPDMAHRCVRDSVLAFQKVDGVGGFFGGRKEVAAQKGVFCFDTSCAAIIGCLWSGHREAARRGGEYILRLAEVSGEERWYWALDSEGAAVESVGAAAWAHNEAASTGCVPDDRNCFMDKARAGHMHYKTGFFLACCAYLFRMFGERQFLDAGLRCGRFALATKDAAAGQPHGGGKWQMWGHKLAWGAAELYAVTHDKIPLQLALEMSEMLVRRQNKEGFWAYEEWFSPDGLKAGSLCGYGAPASSCWSIASQGVVWMAKVRDMIAAKLRSLEGGAAAGRADKRASDAEAEGRAKAVRRRAA